MCMCNMFKVNHKKKTLDYVTSKSLEGTKENEETPQVQKKSEEEEK